MLPNFNHSGCCAMRIGPCAVSCLLFSIMRYMEVQLLLRLPQIKALTVVGCDINVGDGTFGLMPYHREPS